MRRGLLLFALLLIAAFAAGPAFGSAIIGRDVSHATLAIDRHGHAHVTYRVGGRTKVLTASGAINARAPNRSVPQVKFTIRYGRRGNGACLQYDGPPLAWLLEACKAPDGSYWALQSWVRLKPNYGGTTGATELHLSHWRGPLAVLTIYQNWAERRYRHRNEYRAPWPRRLLGTHGAAFQDRDGTVCRTWRNELGSKRKSL